MTRYDIMLGKVPAESELEKRRKAKCIIAKSGIGPYPDADEIIQTVDASWDWADKCYYTILTDGQIYKLNLNRQGVVEYPAWQYPLQQATTMQQATTSNYDHGHDYDHGHEMAMRLINNSIGGKNE